MFKIIEGDFKNNKYSNEEYLDNWPMLYILENGKKAYIGESNHVKTRMTQHTTNEEKRIFNKVHFIYSRLFNQSVTFDYESKLIQYIVADELFQVTNKNSGIADKQYYEKGKYDKKFELLWRKLQQEKLVKHSLEEIENSDLFKYSPYKELNDSQRKAVEDILAQIESGNVNRVVVNGMPGSGKTIVAVYLMKYLADSEEFAGKKIGFVVPQTSLRKTMKFIFRSIYGLTPSQVLSPSDITKKKYDILLVDEAHRLHQYKNISYRGAFKKSCERLGMTTDADELDWILEQSKCAVLFYDYNQVVGPSGIDYERFEEKMRNPYKKHTISYFTLATQMRVQGGNDYIAFIKDLLAGVADRKYHSKKYDLKLYSDFSKFEKDMYVKEEETGLSRMVAGYAWPWISKNDRSKKDIEIQGVKRMWNHCTEGWVHTGEAIDEVGCIHSIQGYDLNYAFVILGNDIGYDKTTGQIIIRSECYFDKNGKITASYEELKEYITNVYYVLMTRDVIGKMVLEIWNERVSAVRQLFKFVRTVVLVKAKDYSEYLVFEFDTVRYDPELYYFKWNKRNNLEGYDKKDHTHRFTWQPSGSQFTIIEDIPDNRIHLSVKKPEKLNKDMVLRVLKYDQTWRKIISEKRKEAEE